MSRLRRSNAQSLLQKRTTHLADLKSQFQKLTAELSSRQMLADSQREELQELQRQQEELKTAIAKQSYKPEEVLQMRSEQQSMKDTLVNLTQNQEELGKSVLFPRLSQHCFPP